LITPAAKSVSQFVDFFDFGAGLAAGLLLEVLAWLLRRAFFCFRANLFLLPAKLCTLLAGVRAFELRARSLPPAR